ncbi:ArnT family glycosyltransferase [Chlorogloeopsis sp. ULAP02]|uniref:ArnT family glycosyltransferase n=1 Tax=Chlorogloeopsis sp. ULAP02 TaxID=3107926 RepID=UPI003134FA0C
MTRLKNFIHQLIIILLFVGFVLAIRFQPISQTFEFDYDEGFNLIKALLYSQGFSLYTQIWNDQPPLFTVLLSYWLNLFGYSIFAARLLILLFSALLIYCFYKLISSEVGKLPALIATILLFTSWLYIRLSISVMIGLPSLSLAMLSIYLLHLYRQNHRKFYIILSGITFALSLQTKLFTILLLPLMFFYIVDFNIKTVVNNKLSKTILINAALWLIPLGLIYILIGVFFQQFWNHDQLITTHLNQPQNLKLENFNNREYLLYIISQDYDYIFLAFIGIGVIFLRKYINGIFPIAWLITAVLILLNHQPLWYHYYPLLAIPICWLAAYGVAFLGDSFFKKKLINTKQLIIPFLLIVILIGLVIATPPNPKGSVPKNMELMQLVLRYKDSTNWIFTDRPIYAFYARLCVPPEIAVMSYKRLNSGELTSQEILSVLQKYRPEQIVLSRWTSQLKSDSKFLAYINTNYSKTYTNAIGSEEHYILK